MTTRVSQTSRQDQEFNRVLNSKCGGVRHVIYLHMPRSCANICLETLEYNYGKGAFQVSTGRVETLIDYSWNSPDSPNKLSWQEAGK